MKFLEINSVVNVSATFDLIESRWRNTTQFDSSTTASEHVIAFDATQVYFLHFGFPASGLNRTRGQNLLHQFFKFL